MAAFLRASKVEVEDRRSTENTVAAVAIPTNTFFYGVVVRDGDGKIVWAHSDLKLKTQELLYNLSLGGGEAGASLYTVSNYQPLDVTITVKPQVPNG